MAEREEKVLMHTMLMVGEDEPLQRTRAAVLAKACGLVTICGPDEVRGLMEKDPVDLVVLCHTVSSQKATSLSEEIHRRWCDTRVLLIVSALAYKTAADEQGFDAVVSSDPTLLVMRATEILRTLPGYRVEDENCRVGGLTPS